MAAVVAFCRTVAVVIMRLEDHLTAIADKYVVSVIHVLECAVIVVALLNVYELFDKPFPYMMCMHQGPVNQDENSDEFYHFHVEFFPPMRSADKQKFNASSETGVWAHCNPTAPEEKAIELRDAHQRFLAKDQEA